MITAPLPQASPSGTGRLSMIIPRYYGLTITLGMCSFQHKWASERQLYLFVLLHHVIMK